MSAKHSRSFLAGVFVLNLLPSVALADPVASVTPNEPEKLVAQAEKALDGDDFDIGLKLYRQAAELNYTPAQTGMGELLESAQAYDEAVGWFLMAATQGDAIGQFDLARMYLSGNGIPKDESKALYWIRRSAAKNYFPAAKAMANAYKFGGFSGLVKADPEQAKSWEAKTARLEAIANKAIDEKVAAMLAEKKKIAEEEAAKRQKVNK